MLPMPGKGQSWELQAEDKECQSQQQDPEAWRQGPVLHEGLVHFSAEGIQEAEPFREHCSHGHWVFLRLLQLPDGNPLEHSLDTPVHSSATASTTRFFACRGFSQSHCFNTLF